MIKKNVDCSSSRYLKFELPTLGMLTIGLRRKKPLCAHITYGSITHTHTHNMTYLFLMGNEYLQGVEVRSESLKVTNTKRPSVTKMYKRRRGDATRVD